MKSSNNNTNKQAKQNIDSTIDRRDVLKFTATGALSAPIFSKTVASSSQIDGPTVYFGTAGGGFYAVDAVTGDKEWEVQRSDSNFDIRSSPTVVEGTVYFGSQHTKFYALDAVTGDQEWTFTEPSVSLKPSPTVVDGVVYAGSGLKLYALDAKTGAKQWANKLSGGITSSPNVVDGTVYIRVHDTLYAMDALSGEFEWWFSESSEVTESTKEYESSPTVADGMVYVGSDGMLYALNATTGEKEWTFTEPSGFMLSSPTVVDGTVYIGSGGSFKEESTLYAVNSVTGEKEWAFTEPSRPIQSSPTVADGIVYVGSRDKTLYAVDTVTGEKEWSISSDYRFFSSPTVLDGTVYIGHQDALISVDAVTGNMEWAFSVSYSILASPTVVKDPASGDSIGTRVNLGTLGHHHVWSGRASGEPKTLPTAAFDFTPDDPVVDEEITFDASGSSDPDGTISTFEWDFDDDGTFEKTGEQVKHTFSDAGDFPVTLRVTDDDGGTDVVTKSVTVKVELGLQHVRLVQQLEDSQVVDPSDNSILHDPSNPELIEDVRTTIVFGFDVAGEALDDINDSDSVEFRYNWQDESGQLNEIGEFELLGKEIRRISKAGSKTSAATKLVHFAGEKLPIFDIKSEMVSFTVELVPTVNAAHIASDDRSITTPALSSMPPLNVVFTTIEDPDSGANYGTNIQPDPPEEPREGRVKQSNYDRIVLQAERKLRKTYPTAKIKCYQHSWNDPVSGHEKGEYHDDLKATRDQLEGLSFPVKENCSEDNGTLERFDVTVAIVPDGYMDFHENGLEGAGGVHPQDTHDDHSNQVHPQESAAVEENEPGSTVAQEIGHHFLPDPSYPDVASMRTLNDNNNLKLDDLHARFEQNIDQQKLVQTKYDLHESSPEAIGGQESIMSYTAQKGWTDYHLHHNLVLGIEGREEWVPAIDETEGSGSPVLSGSATTSNGQLEFTRVWKREGDPMASVDDGDVSLEVVDFQNRIIDEFSTHNRVAVLRDAADTSIDPVQKIPGKFVFTIPFPEEVTEIRLNHDGSQAVMNPVERSVREAVKKIPDSGFKSRPEERRRAIFKKLDRIDKQMERNAFRSAKEAMEEDIRDKLENWLSEGYETVGLQPTKQEMLELVDNMINRLETLMKMNSSNKK